MVLKFNFLLTKILLKKYCKKKKRKYHLTSQPIKDKIYGDNN